MTPDEIKAARLALGMNQIEFARALGLRENGQRTVRRWEKGERFPGGPTQLAINFLLASRLKMTEENLKKSLQ